MSKKRLRGLYAAKALAKRRGNMKQYRKLDAMIKKLERQYGKT